MLAAPFRRHIAWSDSVPLTKQHCNLEEKQKKVGRTLKQPPLCLLPHGEGAWKFQPAAWPAASRLCCFYLIRPSLFMAKDLFPMQNMGALEEMEQPWPGPSKPMDRCSMVPTQRRGCINPMESGKMQLGSVGQASYMCGVHIEIKVMKERQESESHHGRTRIYVIRLPAMASPWKISSKGSCPKDVCWGRHYAGTSSSSWSMALPGHSENTPKGSVGDSFSPENASSLPKGNDIYFLCLSLNNHQTKGERHGTSACLWLCCIRLIPASSWAFSYSHNMMMEIQIIRREETAARKSFSQPAPHLQEDGKPATHQTGKSIQTQCRNSLVIFSPTENTLTQTASSVTVMKMHWMVTGWFKESNFPERSFFSLKAGEEETLLFPTPSFWYITTC